MNSSQTPNVAQTFQDANDASSPAAFKQHLLRIVEVDLADGVRIKPSEYEVWITVISGFSEHLLSPFPSSQESPWDVQYEKASLVEQALEIFRRLFSKAESLFEGHTDVALVIVSQLICLCASLDGRADGIVKPQDDIPAPEQLRNKAFDVTVKTLTNLGECVRSAGDHTIRLGWLALREFLNRCLVTCEGER
jgi:hypothetical protein